LHNLISIDKLFFSYHGTTNILKNISIDINQGEFISIIGPNGCGKSTLAKHMNGILTPSSGKVTVMGKSTDCQEDIIDIRKNVGMVFQNPDNQIVTTIVEEDVAFAPENLGIPSVEIRKQVDKSLELVGMSEYKRHATNQLSGGQKQRVAIASIISMNPKCILLDEPTSMLDPLGRKDVLNLIINLNKKYQITIILITHLMNEACLSDRIIVMDKGKIFMDDNPKSIFQKADLLIDIGLDIPQPTELCRKLYLRGHNVDSYAINIAQAVESLGSILKNKR